MNIYEMSKKELQTKEKEFKKTAYGKEQMYLSYCLPLAGIVVSIALIIGAIISVSCFGYTYFNAYSCYNVCLWATIAIICILVLTLISYILGRNKFIKELKTYVESCEKTQVEDSTL